MIIKASEKGQALILITLAAVGLFAFAALAIDGSMAFSNKRHAQNAADTAAMAGALSYARAGNTSNVETVALARAEANGFENISGDTSTVVTVTVTDVPEEECPGDATGKDITVTIDSYMNTTFSKVLGRNTIESGATATSRACGYEIVPMFNGNAIVGIRPDDGGDCAIDTGNSNAKHWKTRGGGVFSNGCLKHENGKLTIPSNKCVVSVGDADDRGTIGTLENPNLDNGCLQENLSSTFEYDFAEIQSLMPEDPCTGAITSGRYAGGGKVPASGQLTFDNDIFCVSDFGTLDDEHVVLNNATLYVTDTNFDMRFNGGGDSGFFGTATHAGTYTGSDAYAGYYMIIKFSNNKSAADNCNQYFDFRGNGNLGMTGTILAPSTCVDYRGNSTGTSVHSQMVFYRFTGNGGSEIDVTYDAEENHQIPVHPSISLLE
jgi:Flp pilus assembly protein TadG